jgi:hypothetical protein
MWNFLLAVEPMIKKEKEKGRKEKEKKGKRKEKKEEEKDGSKNVERSAPVVLDRPSVTCMDCRKQHS